LAFCPNCYNMHVPKPIAPGAVAPGMPPAGPYMQPPGGVVYGPFPRPFFLLGNWWVPIILFSIAAALIAINGVALLSPVFFAIWVGFFPWVIPLGYFSFILGIILGLVIIGGLVLYFIGFRVLSAFLVFPAAIVSLFIGGGFIIGVIIGVFASMLVIMKQRWRPWRP
jgi:hypothetical protein